MTGLAAAVTTLTLAGTLLLVGGPAGAAATPSRPDAATTTTTTVARTPSATTVPGSLNACKLVSTSQIQSILGGSIAKTNKTVSTPQRGLCQFFTAKKKGAQQSFAIVSMFRPAPALAQFQQSRPSVAQAVSGVGDAAYVVPHTATLRPPEIDFVKSGTEVSIRVYKYNKKALASISTPTLTKLARSAASKL
jgi:hypothetical protein